MGVGIDFGRVRTGMVPEDLGCETVLAIDTRRTFAPHFRRLVRRLAVARSGNENASNPNALARPIVSSPLSLGIVDPGRAWNFWQPIIVGSYDR